jgi:signal peptidase I
MTEIVLKKRKPSVAVMLSLLCTGLGQIYCGNLVKGLVLVMIEQLPIVLVMAPAVLKSSIAISVALILPITLGTALQLYATIDSYRLAKKAGSQYELREYNRGIVYVAFTVIGMVEGLLIAPAIATYVRANVAEAFVCTSDSMNPALLKGDWFLISKTSQRKQPHRGDIIVFLYPENRDIRYIKRVVGLPGDTVRVERSNVYVNGKKLPHVPVSASDQRPAAKGAAEMVRETNGDVTYQIQQTVDKAKKVNYRETKVPLGHCFVLGDYRDDVADSRKFGFVPLGDILGKAEYIYWPVRGWSRFGAIND